MTRGPRAARVTLQAAYPPTLTTGAHAITSAVPAGASSSLWLLPNDHPLGRVATLVGVALLLLHHGAGLTGHAIPQSW